MSVREEMHGEAFEAGFSPRTVAWLAGAIAASLLAALLLNAFGEPGGDGSTEVRSSDRSALGQRALVEFLGESGIRVRVNRNRRTPDSRERTAILVIEPVPGLVKAPDPIRKNLRKRSAPPIVFVLPKWEGKRIVTPAARRTRMVRLRREAEVETSLEWTKVEGLERIECERFAPGDRYGPVACSSSWGEEYALELASAQVLSDSPELEPVLWTEHGALVARFAPESPTAPIYVVSDPDILNNHGLARGDNSAAVLRFIEAKLAVDSVAIDEIVHGNEREGGLLAEVLRFPLGLSICHAGVVFLLVLWRGAFRFGKPVPPPPRLAAGKLELLHASAGLLSYRGKVADSASAYFTDTLFEVAAHCRVPPERMGDDLVSHLQQLSNRRNVSVDLLALEKQLRSASGVLGGTRDKVVRAAIRLHRWRQEMMDEH